MGGNPTGLTMAVQSFSQNDLITVSDALDIAEDVTGNFYKFSIGQWKRHRYDVKTYPFLKGREISESAFAVLNKGLATTGGLDREARGRDVYFICLQDHRILSAVGRDARLALFPLLVYILTHELVHIVRFCSFHQRFDAPRREREQEERLVHKITFKILRNLSLRRMNYVLDAYRGHRMFDMVSQP